jgi:hypothetical protein
MKHHLLIHSCNCTLESLFSPACFKTLESETEVWTFVRVSMLVQFFLPHSTFQGVEI